MTTPNESQSSLLRDTARGGDTNEGGINFQAAVTMAHVPEWLAREGFSSMIREGLFDTEALFFSPDQGFNKEAIEAKDHSVTPKEFWDEIDHFKNLDQSSPSTYQWFTLASVGLSEALQPLKNGLRRVRDPYGFYRHDPSIVNESFNEYVEIVKKLGRDEADAEFLYYKVKIDDDWSLAKNHWQGVFTQSLINNLPHHQDLAGKITQDIYFNLASFIQGRRNKPIARLEIEEVVSKPVPTTDTRSKQPVKLFTAIDAAPCDGALVRFNWERFFGGTERIHVPSAEWNNGLTRQLTETKKWIAEYRNTKRIRVEGSRRLSASVALGYVFSAVSGFAIDVLQREQVWSTDDHPNTSTPEYKFQVTDSPSTSTSKRLVLAIGIQRDIRPDVERCVDELGLTDEPKLSLFSPEAFQSASQVNIAVREIKGLLTKNLQATGASQVELFLAGPSHLALFLGHRLNATSAIQCYELAGSNKYVPTCFLS